ncbi:Odorant receptor 102 [Blattella germanica]|nr:Odorant receptor 102 [Blattella germanica]
MSTKDVMGDARKRFPIFRRLYKLSGNAIFGDGKTILYKTYSYISRVVVYLNWLAIVVDTIFNLNNLERLIENVSVILPHLCSVWLDIFLQFRKSSMEKILMETNMFAWEDYPLRDEVTGWPTLRFVIVNVPKICFCNVWFTVISHSSYMVYRGVTSRDILGFNAWFPFDSTLSPMHELVIAMQIYYSFMMTAHFYNNVAVYSTIVSIGCIQLNNLLKDIHSLQLDDLDDRKKKTKFKECVRYHQKILNYLGIMQDSLNVLMFGHFLIIIIGMAFAAFSAVMSWQNLGAMFQLIVVFFGQMILLAVYCILGTHISTLTEDVRFAIYESDWIGSPVPTQKSMVFMMAAANNEFKLSAGGFIPVTRETMLAMLNQMFSYTMFLLNFKDEEE